MASITHHKLNTGASIPAIGFGTWQDKDDQEKAVLEALKAGFRHIDGAASQSSYCIKHSS
jgi:alcohol dehydrogenase (NADP+)